MAKNGSVVKFLDIVQPVKAGEEGLHHFSFWPPGMKTYDCRFRGVRPTQSGVSFPLSSICVLLLPATPSAGFAVATEESNSCRFVQLLWWGPSLSLSLSIWLANGCANW